jgi:hypothetical protein
VLLPLSYQPRGVHLTYGLSGAGRGVKWASLYCGRPGQPSNEEAVNRNLAICLRDLCIVNSCACVLVVSKEGPVGGQTLDLNQGLGVMHDARVSIPPSGRRAFLKGHVFKWR